MKLEYTNINYSTIKQVLKQEFNLSARLVLKLKRANQIFLNGKNTFLDKTIVINDIVTVNLDFEEESLNIISTKMNLKILFEDDSLLILDKPAGVPVHPSMDHYFDSLSNGVKYYFESINLKRKIRPVNRLDRNTSGIVVFAKNEYIQERLSKQMETKEFKKTYIAFCEGIFDKKENTITFPISRKENSIIEREVNFNGDLAITKYKVISEKNDISKVHILLETGRTHQIRVHMSYIQHPLLGDDLYGGSLKLINRQALHASMIQFIHPITHKNIVIKSSLPMDLIMLENIQ